MIKYKACAGFIPSIIPVQVDRETEHMLWISYDGSRVRKISETTKYCDSIDEAEDFIIKKVAQEMRG